MMESQRRALRSGLPVGAALVFATIASAQVPAVDTTRVVPLQPVVVSVERSAWPLSASAAAVSHLNSAEIAELPNATLADALRQVPGIALVDFNGDGSAPQVMARGFYGGGEAEYVVVLLNGKPINDVQTGTVRWDAIPLVAIERIEVLRGGVSALYGDAAIGAVLNVITRNPLATTAPSWSVSGGSYGAVDASGYIGGTVVGRPLGLFAGVERTDGFRDHAERILARAGGTYSLLADGSGQASLSGLVQWRDYQEPGRLLDNDLAADRSASAVFHRFDETRENSQRLALDGERLLAAGPRLDLSLAGERRDVEAVRTLAAGSDFSDTKQRDLGTMQGIGSAQLSFDDGLLPFGDRFIIGADASYGNIDSEYYAIQSGSRQDYAAGSGEKGALDASGTGHRNAAAAFAEYTLLPAEAVRISLGLRADWLRDTFRSTAPDDEEVTASHSAVSPKGGINVRWLETEAHTGHVYANVGRSFKAPTLDQLFDQRSVTIEVPFPPFSLDLTTSNALLEPQYGTQLEVGLYHTAALVPGVITADLSAAAYQMEMEDEIDFDLSTFQYRNIAESRHRGLEVGLRLTGARGTSAFLNSAFQSVIARNGDDAGNQLKAVPRQIYNAGVSARVTGPLQVGLGANHTRGVYLDDANTIEHPAFTRVDARLDFALPSRLAHARIFLDVRNLLDASYSTTGYPDPSHMDEMSPAPIYYYPAAGRALKLGLRMGS